MLKLLALLPIVGIALALQAEAVTNYVYDGTAALVGSPVGQQQEVVKKAHKTDQSKVDSTATPVK